MEDEKVVRLGVIVPEQLLKDVKHLAIEKNTTISEIVRKNLELEVSSQETNKKAMET